MATFSHTPYFFNRLTVLSPVVDRAPRSESDFLLLPVERADDFLASFGVPSKSLRVNFCPPLSECEWTEGGPFGLVVLAERGSSPVDEAGDIRREADEGGRSLGVDCSFATVFGWAGVVGPNLPPDTPADILGALLGGCVDGTLQLSLSDADSESLVEGVIEPVVDEESRLIGGTLMSVCLSIL